MTSRLRRQLSAGSPSRRLERGARFAGDELEPFLRRVMLEARKMRASDFALTRTNLDLGKRQASLEGQSEIASLRGFINR